MTDGRGQMADDRWQRTDNRWQRTGFIGLLHLQYLKKLAKNTTRKNKKGAGDTFPAPFLFVCYFIDFL
jgi:hypothetical protein